MAVAHWVVCIFEDLVCARARALMRHASAWEGDAARPPPHGDNHGLSFGEAGRSFEEAELRWFANVLDVLPIRAYVLCV